MTRDALDDLKRQIPLMAYLETQNWRPQRSLSAAAGWDCAPCTRITSPASWSIRGMTCSTATGAVAAEISSVSSNLHQVKFPQALTLLLKWRGIAPPLDEAARFYQSQLPLSCAALTYLRHRGVHSHELVEHMRIGYAPGGCLRRKLTESGHSLSELRDLGLVTASGCDTFADRIVFPLEGNLYGRSLSSSPRTPSLSAWLQRWPCTLWDQARQLSGVILVEGLFDYAVIVAGRLS